MQPDGSIADSGGLWRRHKQCSGVLCLEARLINGRPFSVEPKFHLGPLWITIIILSYPTDRKPNLLQHQPMQMKLLLVVGISSID